MYDKIRPCNRCIVYRSKLVLLAPINGFHDHKAVLKKKETDSFHGCLFVTIDNRQAAAR